MAKLVVGTDKTTGASAIVVEHSAPASITPLSVAPSTSQQTIAATGGIDGYAPVTVGAVTSSIDANIQANNIRSGVSILGVTGNLTPGVTPSGTINITTNGTHDVTAYANASVNVSGGGVPGYYKKLRVTQEGALEQDWGQTTFSTSPATYISQSDLFANGFTAPYDWSIHASIQTIDLDSLLEIYGDNVFSYTWPMITTIQSFSAANLREITGNSAFTGAFADVEQTAGYKANWEFPALESCGASVFQETWARNSNIESISFPLLSDVVDYCFLGAFESCHKLTTASFPSLSYVGPNCFASAFAYIDPTGQDPQIPSHTLTLTFGGTDPIDFDGNVDCFDSMLDGTTVDVTINAPAASQSDIENMTGYPDFGCLGTVTWNWVS